MAQLPEGELSDHNIKAHTYDEPLLTVYGATM